MAGETVITIIGNLTSDPELRWTRSGTAVAAFTVASTPRAFDRNAGEWRDGSTLFMRCSVWREVAENVAESLRKGMRVIVQGRLSQRAYETQQGERRTVVEMQVDEVGPSLRRARAQVIRNPSGSTGGGEYQAPPAPASASPEAAPSSPAAAQQSPYAPPPEDPWAAQQGAPAFDGEPPF